MDRIDFLIAAGLDQMERDQIKRDAVNFMNATGIGLGASEDSDDK